MPRPRRRRGRAPWPMRWAAPARPGSRAEQLQGFFDHALCSPVLTAHPTEIRRKSSIDREMEIARLLDERDRIEFTPEELAANRRALRRNVLTLWQTSLVRGTRLRVIDEVANGLSYYDYTFLRALAAVLRRSRAPARRHRSGVAGRQCPVLPAHGKLDRRRPRRQSLRHRRGDAPDARHAKRARHALLSRGAASAGRRAVARWPHRARVGRPQGLGGKLARPCGRAPGRALSPRHRRHVCAACRHRLGARQARSRRIRRSGRRQPMPR